MILDRFKLDGRIALVTGGARGLGQSIAYGLAQAGADIACVSKSGQDDEIAGFRFHSGGVDGGVADQGCRVRELCGGEDFAAERI